MNYEEEQANEIEALESIYSGSVRADDLLFFLLSIHRMHMHAKASSLYPCMHALFVCPVQS